MRYKEIFLIDVFHEQSEHVSDKVALIYDDHLISYGFLSHLVNQFSLDLFSQGVKPQDKVGICLNKSIELVVSILSVLNCGATYIPLNPGYPEKRIKHILLDTDSKFIITQQENYTDAPEGIKNINILCKRYVPYESSYSSAFTGHSDVVSIIHTSGTTGEPKSVLCCNKSILNRLYWIWSNVPRSEMDIYCFQAKFSFVDHLGELFCPLLKGNTVLVANERYVQEIDTYINILEKYSVNHMFLTPSFLSTILDIEGIEGKLLYLKVLEVSGEIFGDNLCYDLYKKFPNLYVIDRFGSTETTAIIYTLPSIKEGKIVRDSKVIHNTQLHILDEKLLPVSEGQVGELYVSGKSLSWGYYKDPMGTAIKYIPNPLTESNHLQLYKTGDKAQFINGYYKLLGRVDQLLKIRGFRVDPVEIEKTLLQLPNIKNAVILQKDSNLIAFILSAGLDNLSETKIREFLKSILPEYMIPNIIWPLKFLPVNEHGKLDKIKILEIFELSIKEQNSYKENQDGSANKNSISLQLCQICKNLLSNNTILQSDDFFKIGGDSLSAVRLMMRIKQHFQVNLPINTVFRYPTIEQIAQQIEKAEKIPDDYKKIVSLKRRVDID
jgi:amino acid adenylation domain-containing protein